MFRTIRASRKSSSAAAVLIAVLLVAMAAAFNMAMPRVAEASKVGARAVFSKDSLKMHDKMRRLWEEHIFYTRSFIVSSLENLNDREMVTQRLNRNQDDIADAFKPFLGDDSAKKLAVLLRLHVLLASEFVTAAKAGKSDDVEIAQKRWRTNCEDVAECLSSANPQWNKKLLQEVLCKRLSFITDQVTARIKKDWGEDIEAYDKGHEHMLMIADALSDGLLKQYPERFPN